VIYRVVVAPRKTRCLLLVIGEERWKKTQQNIVRKLAELTGIRVGRECETIKLGRNAIGGDVRSNHVGAGRLDSYRKLGTTQAGLVRQASPFMPKWHGIARHPPTPPTPPQATRLGVCCLPCSAPSSLKFVSCRLGMAAKLVRGTCKASTLPIGGKRALRRSGPIGETAGPISTWVGVERHGGIDLGGQIKEPGQSKRDQAIPEIAGCRSTFTRVAVGSASMPSGCQQQHRHPDLPSGAMMVAWAVKD